MAPAAFKAWPVSDSRTTHGWTRWRALGRLLPASVRERVFEPAFADLLRETLEVASAGPRRSTAPFAVKALGTYAGCLPPSLIQLFVVSGKPTRFARAVGVVAVVGIALRLVALWMGDAYATGP